MSLNDHEVSQFPIIPWETPFAQRESPILLGDLNIKLCISQINTVINNCNKDMTFFIGV